LTSSSNNDDGDSGENEKKTESVPSSEDNASNATSSLSSSLLSSSLNKSSEEKEAQQVHDTATSTTTKTTTLPSYKTLLLFTCTTILIWISEPLLSLVDTTVVGLTQANAVVQVAAMGPATTLIDSLQYLTYFLAMATTAQIAKFLALEDFRTLQETNSQILGVAAVLGCIISAILFLAGKPILQALIGGSSTSPELVSLAARYCWIRASVAPLAVMGMVAESNCLANVDTKTPAIAVFSASVINVIGDLALSFMGIQGAAIATAVATATSATIMLRRVRRRSAQWRKQELQQADASSLTSGTTYLNGARDGFTSVEKGYPTTLGNAKNANNNQEETSPIASSSESSSSPTSSNGSKANQNASAETTTTVKTTIPKEVPFLSFPNKKSLTDLLTVSGPMFFVMFGKILCYGAMSIRATDFGVVNLAAHSIMMRIFFFFACFGDSLSQAVQSFLPTALYPIPDVKNTRKMLTRFLVFTTFVAVLIAQSSHWILSNLGSALTNDKAVVAAIAKHSPFVTLSLLVHPFIMLTEGTMIATRDFKQIMTSYSVITVMHFGLLLFSCTSFKEIWRVFFIFQSIRLALFGTRVFRKVARPTVQQQKSYAS